MANGGQATDNTPSVHWVLDKTDNAARVMEFKQVLIDDYHSYLAQYNYIAKRDYGDDMFIYAGIDMVGFPSVCGIHVRDGLFVVDNQSHYWFIEESDEYDFLRFINALKREGYTVLTKKNDEL